MFTPYVYDWRGIVLGVANPEYTDSKFNNNEKISLIHVTGKKNYDKRDSMLEKEHERNIQFALKNKYK